MISVAQLILDRIAAGLDVRAEWRALPAYQMSARWSDLAPHCPSGMQPALERRGGNALNIEIGRPMRRCAMMSPDGLGLRWLASGGPALAYGVCNSVECLRARDQSHDDNKEERR